MPFAAILHEFCGARDESENRSESDATVTVRTDKLRALSWGRLRVRGIRSCLAGLVAALVAATPLWAKPRPAAPPAKLVVAISVDQFALDLYRRYRPTYVGGLKRLSEGLVFTGYQSHAATETCPGHSTILTGDHPARTGIVANTWYDRATGSRVYCVSVPGDPEARGPGRLKVDTLGDWLKRAHPGARSVAVSGKDRAAIMMGGHHADAVYWWADGTGFTTSAYAGPATPAVLEPAQAFDAASFAAWRASPPRFWPKEVPARCAALERPYRFGALELSGAVPPQTAPNGGLPLGDSRFDDEFRASPAFDPMTLDFAAALVRRMKLGRGPSSDLLAVSLSATDLVGHRYGPGGAEMCVQMAALDSALGRFFQDLDRQGLAYTVVLTADHGSSDAPERAGPPAVRIDAAATVRGLVGYLRERFGLGYDPLVGDDPRELVFAFAPLDQPRRAEIVAAAAAWLRARPEVAAAFSADEIARVVVPKGAPAPRLTLAERFAESFDPERSGDILVAYVEGATLGAPHALGENVAGHGSPWDYDRRVPILFWWRGVRAIDEPKPIETVDIAPTLAAVLHAPAPPVDGRCLDIGQGCRR
jgi:predicted AlkP superfamily pyrophosphatase or phosphodiesterase